MQSKSDWRSKVIVSKKFYLEFWMGGMFGKWDTWLVPGKTFYSPEEVMEYSEGVVMSGVGAGAMRIVQPVESHEGRRGLLSSEDNFESVEWLEAQDA